MAQTTEESMPQQALKCDPKEVTRNLRVVPLDQDPEETNLSNDEPRFLDEFELDVEDQLAAIRLAGQAAAAQIDQLGRRADVAAKNIKVIHHRVNDLTARVNDLSSSSVKLVDHNKMSVQVNRNFDDIKMMIDSVKFEVGFEREAALALADRVHGLELHARAQAQQPRTQEPAFEKLFLTISTIGTLLCVLGLAIKFLF